MICCATDVSVGRRVGMAPPPLGIIGRLAHPWTFAPNSWHLNAEMYRLAFYGSQMARHSDDATAVLGRTKVNDWDRVWRAMMSNLLAANRRRHGASSIYLKEGHCWPKAL